MFLYIWKQQGIETAMINMKDIMPEFVGKRVLFCALVLVKKKMFVFIEGG